MTDFPLWAHRLYNEPLALDRFKNDVLCQFAEQRLSGVKDKRIDATSLDLVSTRALADEASFYSEGTRKPYATKDGIAVVPVRGTLVHRSGYLDAESGLVGYNRLLSQLRAAASDPDVGGIFVPYMSGGGECAGMLAAAEEIAAMAASEGGKPIYAYLDVQACSAAYVLASASDKIYGRRDSTAGSIAVIANLIDTSEAFAKAGLKPITVRSEWADHKALIQPGQPVPSEALESLLAKVDNYADMMVEFVAAMRRTSEKAIKNLRGESFDGSDALTHGLIDGIKSEREAWDALRNEIRSR